MPLSRILPLVMLLASTAAFGCSASPWKRTVLRTAPGIFIYSERKVEGDDPARRDYRHPVRISPAHIEELLARLVYEDKPLFSAPVLTRVFLDDERTRLAPLLADSLGRLDGGERLRFLVTRESLTDYFAGVHGVSGVMFQTTGPVLHIAFDAIDEVIYDGEGGRPDEVRFPLDPTEEAFEYGLLPPPGARLHVDEGTGEVRKRWLEIDRATLAASPAEPVGPAEPAASAEGAEAADPEGPTEGETVAAGATGAAAASADPEPADPAYERLKQQVERLRRLRADGLLTDEEFESQLGDLLAPEPE